MNSYMKDAVIKKLFLLMLLFLIPKIYAECSAESLKKFKQDLSKGSFVVYTAIQNQLQIMQKIVVANTEFLKPYGVLKSYLECANNHIKAQAGSLGVKNEYVKYCAELGTMLNWINGALHIVQRSSAVIRASDYKKNADVRNSEILKDFIRNDVLKLIPIHLEKISKIFNAVLKDITKESDLGLKNKIAKRTKEEIFPEYKQFFDTFKTAKKKYKSFLPEDIRFMLSMEDLIEPDRVDTIIHFVYMLEQFKDQVTIEKKKAWFGTSNLQNMIDASQEIINALDTLYPNLKVINALRRSDNSAAVILSAEAGGLYGILQKLQKESELLL